MKTRKLSAIKDAQERKYYVEDAARTFKRLAEVKREIKEIKADPGLLKAVKVLLRAEIAETQKVLKS